MIECKKQYVSVLAICDEYNVASIRSLRSMDRSFQARSFHLIIHSCHSFKGSPVDEAYVYCQVILFLFLPLISQQLSPDGTLTKPANSKLLYGTMSFVRAQIVFSSFQSLSQALTIAIRYSAVRRQGKLKPG